MKLILHSNTRCSLLGLICCLNLNPLSGQSFLLLQTSPYLCINSYSQQHAEVVSLFENPALLMKAKKKSLGIYTEKNYLSDEIVMANISFASCSKDGSIGLNGKYSANNIYAETEMAFYYAKKLFKDINVGIGFQYQKNKMNKNAFNRVLSSNIGVEIKISPILCTGFSWRNPFKLYFSKKKNEVSPYQYSFSMGFDPVEQFFCGISILKTEDLPVEINTGVEYIPNQKINYRLGVFPGRHSIAFGVGFLLKKMLINVSFFSHQQLGMCPGIFIVSKGKQ